MATRKKPAAKASGRKYGAPADAAETVDEFGRLADQIGRLATLKKRYEALRKRITGWYAAAPADAEFTVDGDTHSVTISAKAKQRKIGCMEKLFRKLTKGRFLEVCTVPLKVVDDHIPVIEREKYLVEEQTGPRKVVPMKRAAERRKAA